MRLPAEWTVWQRKDSQGTLSWDESVGASGKGAGVVVLVAFLVGLLTSNTVITLGSSFGFLRASQNWKIYVTVAVLTGTFSLIIGTLFLFGKATLLPALFGG